MDRIEGYKVSNEWDKTFESMKWMKSLPYISFPSHWKIQIIPPFANAIIRFRVRRNDDTTKWISVYFDGYELLGSFEGGAYWEIYPDNEGDVSRFAMADTAGMIEGIEKAFDRLERN